MANRYSHAFVLSHYESCGLTNFSSFVDQNVSSQFLESLFQCPGSDGGPSTKLLRPSSIVDRPASKEQRLKKTVTSQSSPITVNAPEQIHSSQADSSQAANPLVPLNSRLEKRRTVIVQPSPSSLDSPASPQHIQDFLITPSIWRSHSLSTISSCGTTTSASFQSLQNSSSPPISDGESKSDHFPHFAEIGRLAGNDEGRDDRVPAAIIEQQISTLDCSLIINSEIPPQLLRSPLEPYPFDHHYQPLDACTLADEEDAAPPPITRYRDSAHYSSSETKTPCSRPAPLASESDNFTSITSTNTHPQPSKTINPKRHTSSDMKSLPHTSTSVPRRRTWYARLRRKIWV